jgi:hypothetical protein
MGRVWMCEPLRRKNCSGDDDTIWKSPQSRNAENGAGETALNFETIPSRTMGIVPPAAAKGSPDKCRRRGCNVGRVRRRKGNQRGRNLKQLEAGRVTPWRCPWADLFGQRRVRGLAALPLANRSPAVFDFQKLHLLTRPFFTARAVGVQAGRDDEGFSEVMVEDDQAVVKAGVAIGQFEVVDGAARQFWFDKIFQVVAPMPKQPPSGNGRSISSSNSQRAMSAVENVPRIAELDLRFAICDLRFSGSNFTTRTEGAES